MEDGPVSWEVCPALLLWEESFGGRSLASRLASTRATGDAAGSVLCLVRTYDRKSRFYPPAYVNA